MGLPPGPQRGGHSAADSCPGQEDSVVRIGTRLILSLAMPLILMIAVFGLVDEASNRARARIL